jgi:hypothetical protein
MSSLLHDSTEIQSPQPISDGHLGLSHLIRSKGDAMLMYNTACWFATRDQQEELYGLLEYLIEKWDTPEFTVLDVEMLESIVNSLCHIELGDHEMEYEGPEFGYAKGLLEALAEAARRRITTDQKQSAEVKASTPVEI